MDKPQDNREFLIDNLKGVLIFLVVFAHYIGTGYVYKESSPPEFVGIYAAIYAFHMPFFMFSSGYLSKNYDKMRETAFLKLYIPFFIFNGLLYGLLKGNYLFFFCPNSHLWYLFILFLFRILLKDLARIRFIMLISIALLIMSPFLRISEVTSRFFAMLPYFLAGAFTSSDTISKIKLFPRVISGLILLILLGGIYYLAYTGVMPYNLGALDDRTPGVMYKLALIPKEISISAAAVIIGFCLINLTPCNNGFIAKIGRSSVTVYIFHLVPYFREFIDQFNIFRSSTICGLLYWFTIAALVTYITSRSWLVNLYDRLINFIEKCILRRREGVTG